MSPRRRDAWAILLGLTALCGCATVESGDDELRNLVTAAADQILQTQAIRQARRAPGPVQIAVLSLHERTPDGLEPCPPGSPRWLAFQRAIHEVFEAPLYTDDLDHVHYQFVEPYLPGTLDQAFDDMRQESHRHRVLRGVEETGVTLDYVARGILNLEAERQSLHLELLHARSGLLLTIRTAPRRR